MFQTTLFREVPLKDRAIEWLQRMPQSQERDLCLELLADQRQQQVVRTAEIADSINYPHGMNTAAVRESIQRWVAYQRREKRRKLSDPRRYVEKLLQRFMGQPDLFVAAVEHSIDMGYMGLFPPAKTQYKALTGSRFSQPAVRGDI